MDKVAQDQINIQGLGAEGFVARELDRWNKAQSAYTFPIPGKPEMQSQSIGKLADALAKAQGKMQGAKKDSENPFFKSSYADLASVWSACREHLSANGLAVIQAMDSNGWLRTTLAHSSGEWIASTYPVKPTKEDPQALGSAITYARRYSLAAIVGIAPEGEDDDSEAAMGRATPAGKKAAKGASSDTAEAAEVLKMAEELSAKIKQSTPDCLRHASMFVGRDGNEVFFQDPFGKNVTPKWLAMTKKKLGDALAKAELGDDKVPF